MGDLSGVCRTDEAPISVRRKLMNDPTQNPYPGPEPFGTPGSVNSRCGFFGRESEISRLGYTVLANPVVVMYAPSGAGKTSLVNAGLIPWLEEAGTTVIASTRLRQEFPADLDVTTLQNVFVTLAINSLRTGYRTHKSASDDAPMLEVQANTPSEPRNSEETTLPLCIGSLCKSPQGSLKPQQISVVIFDQFEEIFDIYDMFWQHRKPFFQEIASAVKNLQRLHIVFVMREEYLAKMTSYASCLPGNLEARFYIEPLRSEKALEAIYKPAESSIRPWRTSAAQWLTHKLFTGDYGTEGAKEFEKEFVDSTILQILCHDLWEKAKTEQKTDIDEQWLISQDKEHGLLDNCLSNFYLKQLKAAASFRITEGTVASQVPGEKELSLDPATLDYIESITDSRILEEMERIGSWIEKELIDGKKRKPHIWKSSESAITDKPMQALMRNHLIRPTQKNHDLQVIELSHDRLVKAITEENERMRLALTGLRFGLKDGVISDDTIKGFIEQTAYYISREEKRKYISDADVDELYLRVAPPDFDIDNTCYVWARAHFALAILEGRPRFEKLSSKSYRHLELSLFSDVKQAKAYLLWKRRGGYKNEDVNNYLEVCERFRKRALNDKAKLSLKQFQKVKEYIEAEYLTNGKLDDDKPGCHQLLNLKAGDVWMLLHKRETDETHWKTAKTTAALFYENIIPAVEFDDAESLERLKTLFVRHPPIRDEAIQRAELVDCFQVAIITSFLKPSIVSKYALLT
jgi:hypothetical protein